MPTPDKERFSRLRPLLAASLFLPPFLAVGCLALGAESGGGGGMVGLTLETLLIVYGPMAGMLIWFMYREKKRDEREAEQRKEFIRLIENCTGVMTEVKATLVQVSTETEKTRAAIYQVRDIIGAKDIVMTRTGDDYSDGRGTEARGNTKLLLKD